MVRDADLEIVFANESLDEDLYSFATSKKKQGEWWVSQTIFNSRH